jgi:hypothetical protein
MNDNFRCGDPETLVAYLYDEGEPAEREAVAAHVARCVSCAEEIESLRGTRALLSAWTPPQASLGFRITRAEEPAASNVVRPAAWWRRPLPAWAQAAAAVLIFAAGITVGGRDAALVPGPVATPAPATAPIAARAPLPSLASAVSRDELARLEQRLRAVETARVQAVSSQPSASPANDAALMRQVEALIAASDERQEETNVLIVNALRQLDLRQRVDLREVGNRLETIHDATRVELGRQNNALSSLIRRTSFTDDDVR